MKCDCNERIGIEINSYALFEELRSFFENQVSEGVFRETPVEEPYFTSERCVAGDKDGLKFYADKWYVCNVCGTLWEFGYPDFPAPGMVRKFENGIYSKMEE